jgi:hypothetical protein
MNPDSLRTYSPDKCGRSIGARYSARGPQWALLSPPDRPRPISTTALPFMILLDAGGSKEMRLIAG